MRVQQCTRTPNKIFIYQTLGMDFNINSTGELLFWECFSLNTTIGLSLVSLTKQAITTVKCFFLYPVIFTFTLCAPQKLTIDVAVMSKNMVFHLCDQSHSVGRRNSFSQETGALNFWSTLYLVFGH